MFLGSVGWQLRKVCNIVTKLQRCRYKCHFDCHVCLLYPKLQVLMIAALNYERLKLTPDVSVEHWLLLRIEALILKHWTWVSSQYQWHRRSLITTRFGSRSMDFMASNFETGMNNRITWTEDIFSISILHFRFCCSTAVQGVTPSTQREMQMDSPQLCRSGGLGQVLTTWYCWWKISCQTC